MNNHRMLKKDREIVDLGTFEMVSGVARISDPCYDKRTWCAGKIKDVLNGTWKSEVIKMSETYEYENPEEWAKGKTFNFRRNVLIAVHESFDKAKHTNKVKINIHGGIDAGMAGIFDDKFYKKNYKEDYLQVGSEEYNHESYLHSKIRDIPFYEAQILIAKGDPKKSSLVEYYETSLEMAKNAITNPTPVDYSRAVKTRDWYEICCDKSLSNIGAGVIRNGVVSSSGYGDGGYRVLAVYNEDNKVVGIKLIF